MTTPNSLLNLIGARSPVGSWSSQLTKTERTERARATERDREAADAERHHQREADRKSDEKGKSVYTLVKISVVALSIKTG
ncbi:hypothetical protein, partial [Streptomyces virginiae]|uniref:hypothetical protein n=1 Tax=Streptomyces virginiae TaxID=1961 RepID=UPI00331DBEDC